MKLPQSHLSLQRSFFMCPLPSLIVFPNPHSKGVCRLQVYIFSPPFTLNVSQSNFYSYSFANMWLLYCELSWHFQFSSWHFSHYWILPVVWNTLLLASKMYPFGFSPPLWPLKAHVPLCDINCRHSLRLIPLFCVLSLPKSVSFVLRASVIICIPIGSQIHFSSSELQTPKYSCLLRHLKGTLNPAYLKHNKWSLSKLFLPPHLLQKTLILCKLLPISVIDIIIVKLYELRNIWVLLNTRSLPPFTTSSLSPSPSDLPLCLHFFYLHHCFPRAKHHHLTLN